MAIKRRLGSQTQGYKNLQKDKKARKQRLIKNQDKRLGREPNTKAEQEHEQRLNSNHMNNNKRGRGLATKSALDECARLMNL